MTSLADPSPVDPLPPGAVDRASASLPRLAALFAAYYLLQGICEPTAGLLEQPVRTLLERWDLSVSQIAGFTALLATPWSLKPLYGLISDFLPLAGYRRKSYLVLTSAISVVALVALYRADLVPGETGWLLGLLLVPTLGVAFGDVVIDALMIERGQPHNWTGQLQSAQWTALYAAGAFTGVWGGWLSEHHREQQGFLICGCACAATTLLALATRERHAAPPTESFRSTARALRATLVRPSILAAGLFLTLWHFNPFSATVLQFYMTKNLAYSEQFFGATKTTTAVASMVGTALYGLVRTRMSFRVLLHGAVLLGIASTAAYWELDAAQHWTAQAISAAVGFTSAVAVLIQLDLAAQVCPIEVAGTLFAVLMALANQSTHISEWLGGWCYDWLAQSVGVHAAFDVLVGIGCATNAACWLVLPWLVRELTRLQQVRRAATLLAANSAVRG